MARTGEPPPPAGVIHDIGYQHYAGPRLGRWYGVRSLYVHSLRTAYGLGRTAKAKVFPWLLFGVFCVVAVILVMVRSVSGEVVVEYRAFTGVMSVPLVVFLAAVAPELVSRDLRNTFLPLYFSRPLRRSDYALAKLAALISAVLILLGVPLLVLFLGSAFSTGDGLSGVWREFTDLMPGLLTALLYAVPLAALTLLVASLARRQVFAASAIVAVFLVTTPITALLNAVGTGAVRDLAGLWNPLTLLGGAARWLFGGESLYGGSFGPVYGLGVLALTAASVALLLWRYQRVAS